MNVIAVDWQLLTNFPCYLTSLANTKLVSQCTAQVKIYYCDNRLILISELILQLYSYLTFIGNSINRISCVGHSLGMNTLIIRRFNKKYYRIIRWFKIENLNLIYIYTVIFTSKLFISQLRNKEQKCLFIGI